MTRAWARGEGVTLRAATAADRADADVLRALRDGIARGYTGALPSPPASSEWYAIVAAGMRVGVIAFTRDAAQRAVTLQALAVVPEQRGHAYGARALSAAERRLARDGVREFHARVPRGNGHGLYFMLRCGYAPIIPPPVADGTTWFRRHAPPARARPGAATRGGPRA